MEIYILLIFHYVYMSNILKFILHMHLFLKCTIFGMEKETAVEYATLY